MCFINNKKIKQKIKFYGRFRKKNNQLNIKNILRKN